MDNFGARFGYERPQIVPWDVLILILVCERIENGNSKLSISHTMHSFF